MPLRADAARNRKALLKAARACFARKGIGAQMDEVADLAGVGVGTLYRHFPKKSDLVAALLAERLQRLVDLAEGAPTDSAFCRLANVITELLKMQACDRSLSEIVCSDDEQQRRMVSRMTKTLRGVVAQLMAASVVAGELRNDVTVDDVFRIAFNTGLAGNASAWRLYSKILFDGLRVPRQMN